MGETRNDETSAAEAGTDRITFWYGSPAKNVLSLVLVAIIVMSFFTGRKWIEGLALVVAVFVLTPFIYWLKKPRRGRRQVGGATLSEMESVPSDCTNPEIAGILFLEYFVGRFSVGGNGPWGSSPGRVRTRWSLTAVKVSLHPAQFVVEVTNQSKSGHLPLGGGGTWSYHEVERAEAFESPGWARRRGLSRDEYPVGVRLQFGESRTALLIFTKESKALLDGLESHQVGIGRTPVKLSPMLLGRK